MRRPLVEEVSQCDGFLGQHLEKQTVLILHYPWHAPSIPFQTIDISAQCGVPVLACDVYKL